MYKLKASIEFIETVSVDKVARTGQKIEEMNGKFTNEKKTKLHIFTFIFPRHIFYMILLSLRWTRKE